MGSYSEIVAFLGDVEIQSRGHLITLRDSYNFFVSKGNPNECQGYILLPTTRAVRILQGGA